MSYFTARKRAQGLGSAHSGTEHAWKMKMTSVALLVLVPLFVFTFGPILGEPLPEVLQRLSRPIPAAITGAGLILAFIHFNDGVKSAIEDYTGGLVRKGLLIGTSILSYGAIALTVVALVRIIFIGIAV